MVVPGAIHGGTCCLESACWTSFFGLDHSNCTDYHLAQCLPTRHYSPCTEDWFLERTARHPRVREVATQFLGPLRPSYRCRGVYAVFPKLVADTSSAPLGGSGLGPHTDGVASALNCMIYADDCAPGGGASTTDPPAQHHVPSACLCPHVHLLRIHICNGDLTDSRF